MGCPLLLLLFLLVAADVQAQGDSVTCAINGPALYSAETGCYPGPISSDDKSLLFRTDYDGYQVKYVCPKLGQIVCKDPWGCYSEATPHGDCMCKDPGGQSVAITDAYLEMWKNGYEANCGLVNAPKTGAVLPKLEREMVASLLC
ncbi:unnamed protein product, partial [Mesorhabditis spiculigera]